MKRIVIDARESGTTTGRYVDKLIEHLHLLKPSYQFIILAKPHRLQFLRQLAPSFEVISCPIKEFTFAEQFKLKRQIKDLKPDLVFFPMAHQPVWYRGPVVTAMQDLTTARFRNPTKNWLVFTIKQQIYKWLNKKVARKSRQIITPSEFVRQDVANFCHISPSKITTIYDAADKITATAQPYKPAQGKKFLLYVGRPLPHKNLRRLVDAFDQLDRPQLELLFIGKTDQNYQRVQAYAQSKKSAKRIVFPGFVDDAQLRWLYEQAAAYVLPSLSEGFGLPGLEAMQYGTPVVSSQATCLPEVLGDAALYFDPLSVKGMAQQITKVLDDPKLAQDLANRGRQQVKRYSWQTTAQQTLAVFDKVLSGQF